MDVFRKQLEANRQNAKLGGVKTEEGKTVSRYNAQKHGLLGEGITELDKVDYIELLKKLTDCYRPEGPMESFLVERIAICVVRLKRACLLEAEHIMATLHPPITKVEGGLPDFNFEGKTVVVKEGFPERLPPQVLENISETYQRYETAIENKLYRALNQLERMQRLRQGERLPAPVNLEVGVHADQMASHENSPPDVSKEG